MSIYATSLMIEDERQYAEYLAEQGIDYGVIDGDGPVEDLNDLPDECLDAPIVYQGSHVLPSDDDRRGGSVDTAWIPNHIERDDRPELPDGTLKDWLRLGVSAESSDDGDRRGGHATVILTRPQVERLRDDLTAWLDREEGSW